VSFGNSRYPCRPAPGRSEDAESLMVLPVFLRSRRRQSSCFPGDLPWPLQGRRSAAFGSPRCKGPAAAEETGYYAESQYASVHDSLRTPSGRKQRSPAFRSDKTKRAPQAAGFACPSAAQAYYSHTLFRLSNQKNMPRPKDAGPRHPIHQEGGVRRERLPVTHSLH
jgi:hypothetical protein